MFHSIFCIAYLKIPSFCLQNDGINMTYTQEEKRSRIRGIVGAASGNLVEWFDFYIYAVFAAYFTQALTAPDRIVRLSLFCLGCICCKFLYASDW